MSRTYRAINNKYWFHSQLDFEEQWEDFNGEKKEDYLSRRYNKRRYYSYFGHFDPLGFTKEQYIKNSLSYLYSDNIPRHNGCHESKCVDGKVLGWDDNATRCRESKRISNKDFRNKSKKLTKMLVDEYYNEID